MRLLGDAPVLGVTAAAGLGMGLLFFLWLFLRMGRHVLGREQAPITGSRYVFAFFFGIAALGIGAAALALLIGIRDYRVFTAKTRVAEIQAIELAPARLRVYYVAVERDGRRGATEVYELDGDEWSVGGQILRFRPFLTQLGVTTAHRVTRVEGRWLNAEDARQHKPSAFDRAGGITTAWLRAYQLGGRGPFGWMIDGVHGQFVSQLPDRRAIFHLHVTPNGYVLDKKSM